MKISYTWLQDYITLRLSPDELAHRLTMAGLEVEQVETVDGDHVFELEVTPNRPDCLSVLGIAREVSAIVNLPLWTPNVPSGRPPKTKCDVEILDREACGRYIGTVIQGVEVRPAPQSMSRCLAAVGLRPINNVVDVTNFVLYEYGQPLHVFDYDKLAGGKIVVRRARKGERIVTLDGVERTLDPSILVIADAKRPVAIAGIMGGMDTQVTEETTTILLESAYFDPSLIRHAGRKLGLASDSSYRFERGVDLPGVDAGSARAADLIRQMAGGRIVARADDFPLARRAAAKAVEVNVDKLNDLLGAALTPARCRIILKRLGFTVRAKEPRVLVVRPPSFRKDIRIAEDVYEDVARIIGYDNMPQTLPAIKPTAVHSSSQRAFRASVRAVLTAQGYHEIVAFSTTNQADLDKSGLGQLTGAKLQNPLNQDQEQLRPSPLPAMLQVARHNLHHGQKSLQLFEIGKIYSPKGQETETVSLLCTGPAAGDWRQKSARDMDFFDLKGAIEAIGAAGHLDLTFVALENSMFPRGQGSEVRCGRTVLGQAGALRADVLRAWDIKEGSIYYAELNLENIARQALPGRYEPVSGYPPVVRDVSLAVGEGVSWQDVVEICRKKGGDLLTGIRFLEEYRGDKLAAGQRGLVFSLVYQSPTRTLTEEDVQGTHARLLSALTEQLNVQQR